MRPAKDLVSLKTWESWSDGIGFARETRGVNGMYYANGIIGTSTDLRPAPTVTNNSLIITATTMAANPAHALYFFEEAVVSTENRAYLYVLASTQNPINSAQIDSRVIKVKLENSGFGNTFEEHATPRANGCNDPWGQPARYQARWYLTRGTPAAATTDTLELTTVGDNVADTWAISTKNAADSADHFVNLNFQVSKSRRTQGFAILTKDANLRTGVWGATFEVGDRDERALGLTTLSGANFALLPQGLYSYNEAAKSGQVFDDFRDWRLVMLHATLKPYKSGLLIAHPSGLYYYTPGNQPVNIGPDAFDSMTGVEPPGGPNDSSGISLQNGRYHGCSIVGDYIYCLFQPRLTGPTLFIMFGAPRKGDPTDIAWQIIGQSLSSITASGAGFPVRANAQFTPCFVSTLGFSESTTNASPVLWMGNTTANIGLVGTRRVNLDNRGTPFRARSEIHQVAATGNAWMSELFFPDPQDLEELIVVTQDMATIAGIADEWRLSLITDGQEWTSGDTDTDAYVASSIKSNGRSVLPVRRHAVHRAMLHVTWAGASSDRVTPCPTIKRVELRGRSV